MVYIAAASIKGRFQQLCLIALLALSIESQALVPNCQNEEEALSGFFHSIALLTIAGIKPASLLHDHDILCIDQITSMSLPSNLLLFREGDKSWVFLVNLDALEALRQRADFQMVLKIKGLELPKDKVGMLDLFRKAIRENGYKFYGAPAMNAVVGMIMGFPAADVLMYSNMSLRNDFPSTLVRWFEDGSFSKEGFVTYTPKLRDEVRQRQNAAEGALSAYLKEIESGRSHKELLAQGANLLYLKPQMMLLETTIEGLYKDTCVSRLKTFGSSFLDWVLNLGLGK